MTTVREICWRAEVKNRDRSRAVVVGSVSTVLLAGLMAFTLIKGEKTELQEGGAKLLQIADDAMVHRDLMFADLASAKLGCDPSSLALLRRKMIDRRAILDVLILSNNDKIVCSALAGSLAAEMPLTGPFNRTNRHEYRTTWPQAILPFLAQDRVFHVVKEGAAAVVLSPKILSATQADFQWSLEIVNPSDGSPVRSLYASDAHGKVDPLISDRVCSHKHADVCVTVSRSWGQIYAGHRWELNVSPFFAVVFAILSGISYLRLAEQRRSPTGRILYALLRRKSSFYCVYQPIVELASGRIIGCEVLARYSDNEGSLSPSEFIPIIEKAKQTWAFTELLMAKIESDLDSFPIKDGFRISINFYPCDLTDRQLSILTDCHVLQRLRQTGLQLVCELLETGMDADSYDMLAIQHLRQTGVQIAIDDFGCGSSNIRKLKVLRPDLIKIDKSFVDDLTPDGGSIRSTLIPYMIDMANEIKAPIVAEGIETRYQAEVLQALGVQYGQGYFFSRPIAIKQLSALVCDHDETDRSVTPPHKDVFEVAS